MAVSTRIARSHAAAVPASKYFFEDPIRLLCIVCALLLMILPGVPMWLIFLTIGVSQFNGVVMVGRILRGGRVIAPPGGAHGRYWTVQSLGAESFTLSACTLLGGLLLLKIFGTPEPAFALGALTIAVALVPDIRVCRWMMPNDPFRANRALQRGSFLRDPVKLGAILSAFILCLLDPDSVFFVLVSMLLLQFNSIMVLIDKYAAFVEWKKQNPTGARLVSPLSRDGWRVIISVLPLLVLPIRAGGGDAAGWYAAGSLAGIIIVPDLLRLVMLLYLAFCAGSRTASRRARKRLAVDAVRFKLGFLTILFAVPMFLGLAWRTAKGLVHAVIWGSKPEPQKSQRAWNSVLR